MSTEASSHVGMHETDEPVGAPAPAVAADVKMEEAEAHGEAEAYDGKADADG
jgi:hypothetical protein